MKKKKVKAIYWESEKGHYFRGFLNRGNRTGTVEMATDGKWYEIEGWTRDNALNNLLYAELSGKVEVI